ncbi:uncharacterized protein LOC134209851 [Armigeres subalbatus]|uniref:uncharacterized protein LOC134209851 n=1 Tax=Armigeres subalbatus TaxID=124917 RepID=UPI002ED6B8D5
MSIFQLGDRRRKKTTITQLQTGEDEIIVEPQAIEANLFDFFSSLYSEETAENDGNANNGDDFACERVIPPDDPLNEACMEEIQTAEILSAIRASAPKRSPGADGIPREFYLRMFDVIHRELNMLMNEALNGNLPHAFVEGVIVMERIMQAHRVLSNGQKCSNAERNIFQATLALKDRIANLRHHRRAGKLISFDLENAFDRVRHSFLFETMRSLGFNEELISLLSNIASRSTSRLLINGHLSRSFEITRSVRQGDPLSMHLFVLYLHPLLAAGAKLNLRKTVAVNVGVFEGNEICTQWLQTANVVKILGVTFANSIRLMTTLNWDALAGKFSQQMWLQSLRTLTLHQRVIMLNTFGTSRLWYLSSVLPPLGVHTAKITATMGTFLWRGMAARVPIMQLIRKKEHGGLNLHVLACKSRSLATNRHLKEIDSIPYYKSLLFHAIPRPAMSIDNPDLKSILSNLSQIPHHIQQNPSADLIHRHFVQQSELPKVERNSPALDWPRAWRNIGMKELSSSQRSKLYLLVNGKIEHRKLLHVMQRVADENCQHCDIQVPETLQHKFCSCTRVGPAWTVLQQRLAGYTNGWRRLSFEDLMRPVLPGIGRAARVEILRLFVKYIVFVNECNDRIDVDALMFQLDLN